MSIVKEIRNGQPIGDNAMEITDFYVKPFCGTGNRNTFDRISDSTSKKKEVHKIILWVIFHR